MDQRPPSSGSRGWDDMPNAIHWRVLALERDRDDHESRIRRIDSAVNSLRAMADDVSEIKANAARSMLEAASLAREGRNNRYTLIVSAATIVLTIVGSHFFK